jgi:chromosomal replication initiator protein
MKPEELWQAVLAQIQLNTSPANFATWFKNTKIFAIKNGGATVSVPNSFVKEWLENKYNKTILEILHGAEEEIKEVKYIVGKNELSQIKTALPVMPEENQLEFQEFKVDKETNLNPRYLFDSFIVGPFNELAHAAATAVSKNPGFVYNPLFIYGGVGLGKTHLLQATGNEVIKNFPNKKVKYVSSEKFTSEVVSSIKNHKIDAFKIKYRAFDVLIIDDIQFLAGKEKTQEEFFHIFNVLYEGNKQIILSSDKPPRAIQSLAERLKSRFEGGMIADISLPDFESRVAILKTKTQEKSIEIPNDVCEYIASNIKQNIREIEGALNRLIIYSKLNNQRLDLETTKKLLKNIISAPAKLINFKTIIQAVADFYDLKEKDILAASRKKEIVRPRQIAMYLLREELKGSFPFIGRKFNGKDHTTVIHSYKKIALEIGKNKKLEEEIQLLREKILSA